MGTPDDRAKKPGLLVEDMNAIEVTDADGRQRIEKTPDRDERARMTERSDVTRATHPPING